MRKQALLASVWLLLLVTTLSQVVAQGQGVIEGQVVNDTAGAPPESLAGLEVVLYLVSDGSQEFVARTTTDQQGGFRFEGLDPDADHNYRFRLEYAGIAYGGESTFPPGETVLSVAAAVNETTSSDDAIGVDRHHIIIDFAPDALVIQEMYVFNNASDRIYVGAEASTLHFSLPPDAANLTLGDPQLEMNVIETDEGFASLLPVAPGRSQVLYSYTLPWDGMESTLVRRTLYPTANFDLMVADIGIQAESEQLVYRGLTGGEEISYLHFETVDLPAKARIELRLSGAPQGTALPFSPGPSVSLGLQEAMPWMTLALALLGALLPFAQVRLRGRSRPVKDSEPPGLQRSPRDDTDLSVERDELLRLIADLDDALEEGDIGQEAYQQLTNRMKKRLNDLQGS